MKVSFLVGNAAACYPQLSLYYLYHPNNNVIFSSIASLLWSNFITAVRDTETVV